MYTDLTYIATTGRGRCRLTSILDWCSREGLALGFSPDSGAAEAVEVVRAAAGKEFP